MGLNGMRIGDLSEELRSFGNDSGGGWGGRYIWCGRRRCDGFGRFGGGGGLDGLIRVGEFGERLPLENGGLIKSFDFVKEGFKSLVIINAFAVDFGFERVHGGDIIVEFLRGGFGADLGKEFLAKLAEANRRAVVGHTKMGFGDKFEKLTRFEIFPRVDVVTHHDGKNLFF